MQSDTATLKTDSPRDWTRAPRLISRDRWKTLQCSARFGAGADMVAVSTASELFVIVRSFYNRFVLDGLGHSGQLKEGLYLLMAWTQSPLAESEHCFPVHR